MSDDHGIMVSRIKNGTVIDHIPPGKALIVMSILGIKDTTTINNKIALIMNATSRKMKHKDIIKVENRRISFAEANLLALIAPKATINIIENYKIIQKRNAMLPDRIVGFVKCPNPMCVTNNDVEAVSRFKVADRSPLLLRCDYCDTYVKESTVEKQMLMR